MKKGQRLSRDALRAQLRMQRRLSACRSGDGAHSYGDARRAVDLFRCKANSLIASTFDDEIDSLRSFDADTQRTLEEVEAINLLPAHEFPGHRQSFIELFQPRRDTFEVKTRRRAHLSAGQQRQFPPAGIEIPGAALFSEPLPLLFSYSPILCVVNTGSLETSAERFQADTLARFENRGVDPMRPLLPPEAPSGYG